jgi:pimeloyl-ACP methyl ester carboxylesterase
MTCDQQPDTAEPAPLGGQSRWVDLGGPVHYLDFGGPVSGPVIVGVHGLGGAAVNWTAIAPLLTDRFRLLAPDLAGHGLTRSGERGTDVAANRVLLHRFIESVAATPVILMGNSMGGMISLLEASAAPGAVSGLILVDPALPFAPVKPDLGVTAMFALQATPGIGRIVAGRRSRMSPEEAVAGVLALCCADVSRVGSDVVAQHIAVVRQRAAFTEAGHDFAVAMRSVLATAGYLRGHAYRQGIRSITCPVLLLHGSRDRLVPVAAARAAARANPSWSLVVLDGLGHVPQLEAPADTARAITDWLGSAGRTAVKW